MSEFPEVKIEIPGQEQQDDSSLSSCSSSEPFALQVLGDSMEPEFPDKCIIIIEPNDKCSNEAYVMADIEGSRWFRQYMNDGKGERLVAVNSEYPDIPLEGLNWKVEGIIVQRNIKRDIKHYEIY
ncbi:peptidase [Solemya velum gill symbiont]|uniref:S24 family peptidase n=1 Tax=Solemya velum gill symbiont TaxID=2340 RepID=UPI00099621D3|nr:S24 family peptidase [Solemya velum gill symbiont]OOZ14982.1 peptidase [Solemya velum gill symbiont]OOZ19623.1 peptidase [Solemya velum gill symbiont]OOZ22539.1 peptidase [Solemya velum gill symbiont]OOZ23056.1 peptidase [Solemya velum gill symbiont]OOZ29404.1 peptidase [Solemya velum gill symbiont]